MMYKLGQLQPRYVREIELPDPTVVRCPADAVKVIRKAMNDDIETKERFVVLHLNSANQIVSFDVISEGSLNASIVHPREVFSGAILANCASIILAHNHPSGNLEPSREDIAVTKQLREAGVIMDIKVLDHIIVTATAHTAFSERGLI